MPMLDQRHLRRDPNLLLRPPLSSSPPSPGAYPEKQKLKVLSLFLRPIVTLVVASLFFLFAGAAAFLVLLLQISLAGGAFRHHRRRRGHHGHRFHAFTDSVDAPPAGCSAEDLRRLPRFRYASRAADPAESGDGCVVCLSDLKGGDWCRRLPGCSHKFHANCIDKWLIKAPFCPICRGRIRSGGEAIGAEESRCFL